MLAFPIIAFAVALIVIGRGAGGQFFADERKRDRIARKVCFALGIAILMLYGVSFIF